MEQQNIQLSGAQDSIYPNNNHKQVTQGPAEINMDRTPFPGLTVTEDIFTN